MKQRTLEENKLIAEFMGVKYNDSLKQWHYSEGEWHRELKYHSSWDLLMPVVEKIAKTPSINITIESYTVENGDRQVCSCEIKRTFWPRHAVCETELIAYQKEFDDKLPLIQNVWERIIQFIKWFNTQTPTP